MTRDGFYFGAGPAALPEAILREAQSELLDWRGSGLSILEVGHRTEVFMSLLKEAEADLRDLLHIPDNYCVLFLGGAARTQFAMAPMNLVSSDKYRAAYLCTGLWSEMAFKEAARFSDAYRLTDKGIQDQTAYAYYTPNETVDGVRCSDIPDVGATPLVADMTSCLLSEPLDVSRFGVIFAGAQKNIGPAGLTVVIIREDLLDIVPKHTLPLMLDYRVHAENYSLYATPPVFQCDMAAKMFRWVKAKGGVSAFYAINQEKASKLYQYIDASPHYECLVEPERRSLMNVCFSMTDVSKEADFLKAAEARRLKGLKGHRLKGGLRASLYNAMPLEGVLALIAFMDEFVQ